MWIGLTDEIIESMAKEARTRSKKRKKEKINLRRVKIGQIKFRAWDNRKNVMHPNPFNGAVGGMNDIFSNTGDWIYMQYTGLKDKNRAEIYEGDIVAKFDFQDSHFRSVVVHRLGAFGYVYYGDFIAFASNYHFKWINGKSDEILVIGNIFEKTESKKERIKAT